jgi:tRNA threonylcarbamoyladenosine biosynthesis protein TsaE
VTPTETIEIRLPDESATAALASRLAAAARPGDVIALAGELGAGKTALARAFVAARGGGEVVPSPTFTLVQSYETADGTTLWHFDLYRLKEPAEALELGWEDASLAGIVLVEWPDRLGPLLPPERLDLTLEFDPADAGARIARLAGSASWQTRMERLAP